MNISKEELEVLKKIQETQLEALQGSIEFFEKNYGHNIYQHIPFRIQLQEMRVPGSKPLLEEGDEIFKSDQLREKYGEKFERALQMKKEIEAKQLELPTSKEDYIKA